jgi:hypothetical protein
MKDGWQNNRPAPCKGYRFVESIFEELDTTGEWFYNATYFGNRSYSYQLKIKN